jgi:hypothetical protein
MVNYPSNVKPGDTVHNSQTGQEYTVTHVGYRRGIGWEVDTMCADDYSGPRFYPHPDHMPDPDPYVYLH